MKVVCQAHSINRRESIKPCIKHNLLLFDCWFRLYYFVIFTQFYVILLCYDIIWLKIKFVWAIFVICLVCWGCNARILVVYLSNTSFILLVLRRRHVLLPNVGYLLISCGCSVEYNRQKSQLELNSNNMATNQQVASHFCIH